MSTFDSMRHIIGSFLALLTERDEGQDMIEYGLLAALISIVCIVIILAIGPTVSGFYQSILGAFPA